MANTTLQIKKSGVTGNVPSSLEFGELALNYADGKLYYRDATDNISYISTDTTTDSFATINANSSLILATSPTDTLSFAAGNNITITACTATKTITINSQDSDVDQFARNTANSKANLFGYTANTVLVANASGYISNSGLFFTTGNNALIVPGAIVGGGANTTITANGYTTTFDTTGAVSFPGIVYIANTDIGNFANTISANTIYTQGVDAWQNSQIIAVNQFAQSAYDKANTSGGGGANVEIVNDVSSNATRYLSFTDSTSGNVSTLYTSDDKLLYNPSTGTVRLNALEVTSNTNISANTKVITGTSPTTLDTFSSDQYRGAFYQVQMEAGGSFHVLNLSIVNSGGSAQVSSFGDAFNAGPLATFAVSISGGLLILTITPIGGSTTVTFLRHLLVKQTIGIPSGDLGFVSDPTTVFFDAGLDSEPVTSSFDYGYLS